MLELNLGRECVCSGFNVRVLLIKGHSVSFLRFQERLLDEDSKGKE